MAGTDSDRNMQDQVVDSPLCPVSLTCPSSVIFAGDSHGRSSMQAHNNVEGQPDDLSEFCHPVLYSTCRCLGMSDHAIRGWIATHDSPGAMVAYFISAVLHLGFAAVTYTYFHPAATWRTQASLAISISSETVNTLFFWRNGPHHAQTRFCQSLLVLWAVPLVSISAVAIFSPESRYPFSSQPAFCGALSIIVFFAAVTCKSGRVPAMRQPKLSSSLALLIESFSITIRVMDTLTSVLLVCSIMYEVCCWVPVCHHSPEATQVHQ